MYSRNVLTAHGHRSRNQSGSSIKQFYWGDTRMAHIQMTDRNPSDLEPMEELTDGELLAINGGFFLPRPPMPRPPLPPSPFPRPPFRR